MGERNGRCKEKKELGRDQKNERKRGEKKKFGEKVEKREKLGNGEMRKRKTRENRGKEKEIGRLGKKNET